MGMRLPRVAILTGCLLIFTVVSGGPVTAQEPTTPAFKCVESDPYYFHDIGVDLDNEYPRSATPLQGTFDQEPPGASGAPLMMTGQYMPFNWEAEFSGELCGDLVITIYALVPPYPVDDRTGPLRTAATVRADTCHSRYCDYQTATRAFEVHGGTEVATVEYVIPVRYAVQRKLDVGVETHVWWTDVPVTGTAPVVLLWDFADYPSGFTLSMLQPCGLDDPHPDCRFEDLRAKVSAFAGQGLVSPEGETALLGVLDTMPLPGHRASEEGVAVVEEFRVLASDPVNVPSEAARDELLGDADRLITALAAQMSG